MTGQASSFNVFLVFDSSQCILSVLVFFVDVLWMDNKFSWTRSKQIEYIVEILANDDVITSDIDGIVSGGCWGKIAEEFETTYL